MTDLTLFVGLDVHKKTISVAMVEAAAGAAVRFYGTIANTPETVRSLCRKLSRDGQQLHFCYEAGPCGYGVQRQLTRLGHRCDVVAPALIPRKVGDRVKTDRRDAMMLAQTLRAGQLTAVWVPDEAHEAMRDLVRLRAQAMRDLRKTRQQLLSFPAASWAQSRPMAIGPRCIGAGWASWSSPTRRSIWRSRRCCSGSSGPRRVEIGKQGGEAATDTTDFGAQCGRQAGEVGEPSIRV